jgi:hypothetical protein
MYDIQYMSANTLFKIKKRAIIRKRLLRYELRADYIDEKTGERKIYISPFAVEPDGAEIHFSICPILGPTHLFSYTSQAVDFIRKKLKENLTITLDDDLKINGESYLERKKWQKKFQKKWRHR